jgi:hypothetical protein
MRYLIAILFTFDALAVNLEWISAEYFGYEPTARAVMLAALGAKAETVALYAFVFWLVALRKVDL